MVERASYRVYFREGDAKIGDGLISSEAYIPAHAAEYVKSEIKTPLAVDLAKMLVHQLEHGQTTLDFQGIAHVVTSDGPVGMTFKAVWKLG